MAMNMSILCHGRLQPSFLVLPSTFTQGLLISATQEEDCADTNNWIIYQVAGDFVQNDINR